MRSVITCLPEYKTNPSAAAAAKGNMRYMTGPEDPQYQRFAEITLATCTPLADAWEREWVMPEQSPMTNRFS